MGVLHDREADRDLPLPGRVLVGRAPTALLRLADKRVSGEHATLRWTGRAWELRDLASRNGTFVDGVRIESGAAVLLIRGAAMGFGTAEPRVVLVDDGPPGPVLRDLDRGELVSVGGDLVCLPHDDDPQVTLFRDGAGRWSLELGEERRLAQHGEVIHVDGRAWQLLLFEDVEGTATVEDGPTIDTITLGLRASRDEEHVQAWFEHRGRTVPLEPREHLYALLLLARERVRDRDLPLEEQGWVERERILAWLRTTRAGLNVAIHRARGQLASHGVQGAAGIVEVRRGQRRLGIDPARIDLG